MQGEQGPLPSQNPVRWRAARLGRATSAWRSSRWGVAGSSGAIGTVAEGRGVAGPGSDDNVGFSGSVDSFTGSFEGSTVVAEGSGGVAGAINDTSGVGGPFESASGVGAYLSEGPEPARDNIVVSALVIINESTKWAVSVAAFMTLAVRHDASTAWCLLGSIANSVVSHALKLSINQMRPPTARKKDPGMPSSHAQSLAYFGTYIALAVYYWHSSAPLALPAMAGSAALTGFLSWLRVALGFHTTAQVVVGTLAGSLFSSAWLYAGRRWALPLVGSPHGASLETALYAFTGLAVTFFAIYFVRRWLRELARAED